ncbi:hypothetical protein D3C80_1389290 [compost metagenome]
MYGVAVVETRLGTQVETDPAVVGGFFDLAGHQPVFGEGFVQALAHEGVVDQADIIGGHTLVDERVEAVEATEAGLAEGAALGGVRVDVVEVLEVVRVFRRFVIQGHGVLRCGLGQAGQAGQQQSAHWQAQIAQWHHWAFSEVFSHQAFNPRV